MATEVKSLTDYIQQKALKETLKYAAGKAMFCPECQKVLNWKDTVVVTASKDGKTQGTLILCNNCYSEPDKEGYKKLADAGITVEIDKWE